MKRKSSFLIKPEKSNLKKILCCDEDIEEESVSEDLDSENEDAFDEFSNPPESSTKLKKSSLDPDICGMAGPT